MRRNQAVLAVIGRVARRHGATMAQAAIAWALAQGPRRMMNRKRRPTRRGSRSADFDEEAGP